VQITGQLFEFERLYIAPYLNSNSQTIVEKVALTSLTKMVPHLPLNFSVLLEELLTSMVYMGVKVTTCSEIYGDGVKVDATKHVPH
jgi:hypothetical protein